MRSPGVPFLKGALLAGALAVAASGCGLLKPLGRLPAGERRARLEALPNYYDGQFHNGPNPANPPVAKNPWKILQAMRHRPPTVRPARPVPQVQTDLRALDGAGVTAVWFGHSSVLLRTPGATLLIDPIFSNHAGPVPGFVKAFDGADRYGVADLPPIDVLVISHDHYDHLDYRTVRALQPTLKKVVVPAGAGAHFAAWGFAPEQIIELAWYDAAVWPDGLKITATPTQHGSGRTGPAQNKTLWASYVIEAGPQKLYYSGDGGYGPHFGAIGARYGPFDLALMECGQYSPAWPDVHMTPEQTAQAAADLRARLLQPVHWAKFAESHHPWNEPVQRLLPAAAKLGIPVTVPRIGEPCPIGGPVRDSVWWEAE